MAERARQGVKVHVLLDWVGSARMDERLAADMAQAGVQVQRFHPPHWSHLGTHFEVQGPVVAQMQSVFIDNWIKVTGDVLHGPRYFPVLAASGASSAQMFSSSPSGGSESMQLMYLLAITAASTSIDLSAAYRRRPAHLGGLDQFRQPVVPPQR